MNCSPAGTQLGLSKLMVGPVPALTVKSIAFEVPPAGAGFVTVTADVPTEAMLEAGMAAVNCDVLTNVAVVATPPKLTIDDAMKFVPLIVRVKAGPPATAVFGDMEVIVRDGFGGCAFEPLPPQLTSPDTANNKERAHIVREKALPVMNDLRI